ncbi:MAG: hypothetical protein NZ742_12535, partial [Acidobacteria bacterium]|nr:hypothetical protein [Acidobacteriota bacterium]MDW7985506.1 hypothetical protein [Acidobacteriota bacterium]
LLTKALVVLKKPDLEVRWLPEPTNWAVRARGQRRLPPGTRIRFSLADPQGIERWHVEVPPELSRGRGWRAEARTSPLADLPEAYLMVLVIPPGFRGPELGRLGEGRR